MGWPDQNWELTLEKKYYFFSRVKGGASRCKNVGSFAKKPKFHGSSGATPKLVEAGAI